MNVKTIEEAIQYIESDTSELSFCSPAFPSGCIIDCSTIHISCSACKLIRMCSDNGKVSLSISIKRYLYENKLRPELFL